MFSFGIYGGSVTLHYTFMFFSFSSSFLHVSLTFFIIALDIITVCYFLFPLAEFRVRITEVNM